MTKRKEEPQRVGRREAIAGLGAVAVGATVAATGIARSTSDQASASEQASAASTAASNTAASTPAVDQVELPVADSAVRELFGPIVEGSAVSTHWRVEKIHAVRAGAIPVVMSTIYGERFALEVFRGGDGGPGPIARADGLALFLVNGGDGGSPTDELCGLGVMALGQELDARRQTGAPIPGDLLPHAEREARFPNGVFHVPTA